LNAKLPLLDQYGRARQDASRKYSAAFEGHKNIVAQVFVIYVIVTSSSIYLTNCRWRPRRFNEILAKQRYSMCYLLSNSIALTKGLFRCKIQRRRLPVTNQLVKEVISPMHTELDDEQIKFITDSVLSFK
jgi:dTDP-4-amino-4,6-dideoxygalactose transaminase